MYRLLVLFTAFFISLSSVQAQSFVDVDTSHWSYPFVEDILAQGVIDEAYFFHPDQYLTRAELVKMMVTATTGILDDRLPETPSFPDVQPGEWYYPYVETAKLTGLINGYSDGFFRPERQVVRAEAIKIVINGLGIPKSVDPIVRFRDYDYNTAWFQIYVATAFNKGIISGLANSRGEKQMVLAPADPVTRAEMAKVISKALAVSEVY